MQTIWLQITTIVLYNGYEVICMEKEVGRLRELTQQLARSVAWLEKAEAACCGTTMAQCYVIIEIGKAGETTLQEIAEIMGLDKSTMSRTVDNLVRQGLAQREIDVHDRRYVNLCLTQPGKRLYEQVEASMNAYFTGVWNSIDSSKRPEVLASMQVLITALQNNTCCQNGGGCK